MWIPKSRLLALVALPALLLLTTATAEAQRARPVHHPGGGTVVVGAGWGYGYPYYAPYWGWGPWGPWAPYPPYWAGYYYDLGGSVKLDVKPKDTEVYVDGYKAGTVDDFDGTFQRLRLPEGRYTIVLYKEGTKSETQNILVREGEVTKFKHVMQPLAAGAPQDPRPVPSNPPPTGTTTSRDRSQPRDSATRSSRFGTLSLRVQPDDAEVWIDDERWEGETSNGRLMVEVSAGTHRVEVRKDGYVTFVTDVRIRRGDTTNLNVNLSRD